MGRIATIVGTPEATRARTAPNADGMFRFRFALIGRDCATCGLAVAWDAVKGRAHNPWTATLGHVLALEVCGLFTEDVIDVQCWSCNVAAKRANVQDQRGDWSVRPYVRPSCKVGRSFRLSWTPEVGVGLAGAAERRTARAARGIAW